MTALWPALRPASSVTARSPPSPGCPPVTPSSPTPPRSPASPHLSAAGSGSRVGEPFQRIWRAAQAQATQEGLESEHKLSKRDRTSQGCLRNRGLIVWRWRYCRHLRVQEFGIPPPGTFEEAGGVFFPGALQHFAPGPSCQICTRSTTHCRKSASVCRWGSSGCISRLRGIRSPRP